MVNLSNRYEFVIIDLKVWRGEGSIKELLKQAFVDHVTGQEALVVCQVLSRNADFIAVVDQVRDLVEGHPQSAGPLSRLSYEGSREVLHEGRVRIRDSNVPLLISYVNLHRSTGE